jgi:hypothetical protein
LSTAAANPSQAPQVLQLQERQQQQGQDSVLAGSSTAGVNCLQHAWSPQLLQLCAAPSASTAALVGLDFGITQKAAAAKW